MRCPRVAQLTNYLAVSRLKHFHIIKPLSPVFSEPPVNLIEILRTFDLDPSTDLKQGLCKWLEHDLFSIQDHSHPVTRLDL